MIFPCMLSVANAWGRIDQDLASPVTTPALIATIVGGATTISLAIFEDQIGDPVQEETVEDRPLGKLSVVGDYGGQMIPNAAYALSMVFAGMAGNENAYRRAEIMTLATLYSAGVATLLKVTVREPRPNDGNDRRSFPSGHTTTAFAFASVVGAEHGFGYGLLAYGLAGLVAFSRMNDNKHYLHDVAGGATIGLAYGLGIYFRRKEENGGGVAIHPIAHRDAYGLLAELHF